ncbi:probable serine/threonine protein phosphatase 2A regulator [Coccomyxa sp. Obi]|nr:probable serine/threonine protein phosphatase 2A regulator [Coccomyxa sp. Obi]
MKFSAPLGDTVHARFPCSKLKLDNLFLHWLSLQETQKLVLSLLDDAKNGRVGSYNPPSVPVPSSPLSPPSATALFAISIPPLSPQKAQSPRSESSPTRPPSAAVFQKQSKDVAEIPQFFFPGGPRIPDVVKRDMQNKLDHCFASHPEGLTIPAVKDLIREVFQLPTALAYPLFSKLAQPGVSTVTLHAVRSWIVQQNVMQVEPVVRMFDILRSGDCNYIVQTDLKSMLAGILLSHPGLEFLQDTPEFQDRYAETVILRIFYCLDRSGLGRITLRDLKRGDLLSALMQLDKEDDVNKVLKYFSYEHFYVIYCKFWELDADHDFLICKEDLLRYGNHSLTYRIVDRIFSQAARPFASKTEGKMGYEDFVYFILSEEDKTNSVSLDYWFKCIDLDCDGCLRANEMLYFYEEQLHRMECLSQEPVLFEDVLCQMHDMVQPEMEGVFTLQDLKRQKCLAGILFNILFNLNKFIAFETRDPFVVRQEREDPTLTDWDRFARAEYVRLAMEEEGEFRGSDNQNELWVQQNLEGPF